MKLFCLEAFISTPWLNPYSINFIFIYLFNINREYLKQFLFLIQTYFNSIVYNNKTWKSYAAIRGCIYPCPNRSTINKNTINLNYNEWTGRVIFSELSTRRFEASASLTKQTVSIFIQKLTLHPSPVLLVSIEYICEYFYINKTIPPNSWIRCPGNFYQTINFWTVK